MYLLFLPFTQPIYIYIYIHTHTVSYNGPNRSRLAKPSSPNFYPAPFSVTQSPTLVLALGTVKKGTHIY